ncbi:MAG: hypothetical protein AB7H66_05745 [Hyphomonadaceae bacterium]
MDFIELLASLPGVYPVALLEALRRLTSVGAIDPVSLAQYEHQASDCGGPSLTTCLLPLPHPLDFEWRFSKQTSRALLDHAHELMGPNGACLLFGTPGVALETLDVDRGGVCFVGENNVVTRRLLSLREAIGHTLDVRFCTSGIEAESANVIVIDPPWYLDFVRPMLSAATAACRPGGHLLVSLPPEGARSNGVAERDRTLRFALRLGLRVEATYPLALTYATPFFEANALDSQGVRVPHDWRRGDLVLMRKIGATRRVFSMNSVRSERWVEVEIERMRLFVRRDGLATGEPAQLRSIVEGDILNAVSRRDPVRKRASVWTSGNRIFATDNADAVIDAALSLAGGAKGLSEQPALPVSFLDRDAQDRLSYFLKALAAKEAVEERNLRQAAKLGKGPAWTSTSRTSSNASLVTPSG